VNRYFLHIAYDGAPFCGWQRQQNALSVQQVLEEALSALLRTTVSVVGCGRTDAGVNASKYFAHFDIFVGCAGIVDGVGNGVVGADAGNVAGVGNDVGAGIGVVAGSGDDGKFLYQLNAILPKEIVVYEIYEVPGDMHARFSAISRTYKYYIHTSKNPFLNDFSFFVPFVPDIKAINKACEWLVTQKDFTSFAKLHTDNKTNLCDLMRADIMPADCGAVGGGIGGGADSGAVFTFTANRFLRNMVRAMVGTLLEVGCGKMSLVQLQEIVAAKEIGRAHV
jgi:tRNA pseudouridine38-40 synthase